MPRFALETNLPSSKITQEFLYKCVQNMSKLTGKPEMFCVTFVIPDQEMTIGNSNGPCGVANVSSIGGLGVEENKPYCKVFYDLIEEDLGIPKDRLFLTFTENLPEYVTFKGKSFYHITMCRAPGTAIIHDPDK